MLRKNKKEPSLRVALVAEEEGEKAGRLSEAFQKAGMSARFMGIGEISLLVQSGTPKVLHATDTFEDIDAVLLQVPTQLLLFIEPFLTELTARGIYCQLKPTSFNVLCNKPLLYSTLNASGVAVRKTTLLSRGTSVESALKEFSYPIFLEAFQGLDRTQHMLIERKSTLKPFLKSIPFKFDVISIQEFIKADLEENLVIGNDVFTVKRNWMPRNLSHSNKRITTKLKDEDVEMIKKAAKALGCDIALVTTKGGSVVHVSSEIDFANLNRVLGVHVYDKIAQFYAKKVKG